MVVVSNGGGGGEDGLEEGGNKRKGTIFDASLFGSTLEIDVSTSAIAESAEEVACSSSWREQASSTGVNAQCAATGSDRWASPRGASTGALLQQSANESRESGSALVTRSGGVENGRRRRRHRPH